MNIYKLGYTWYEGDEDHIYVMTDLSRIEFEELLLVGCGELNLVPEESYGVKCLPEGYEKLVDWLETKGCHVGNYDPTVLYELDDHSDGYEIKKRETRHKWIDLYKENEDE